MSLTDPSAPILMIMHELHCRLKYKGHSGRIVHNGLGRGQQGLFYDNRKLMSRKAYLQSHAVLDRVFQLVSEGPSDEPLSYYSCLLNNLKVEPGLGHKRYREILKDKNVETLRDGPVAAETQPLPEDLGLVFEIAGLPL